MYLEGSISTIKKPQVVILQNWNSRGSVCKWPKPQRVIMQFSYEIKFGKYHCSRLAEISKIIG